MAKKSVDAAKESLVTPAAEDSSIAAARGEIAAYLTGVEDAWASSSAGVAMARKAMTSPDARALFESFLESSTAPGVPFGSVIRDSEFGEKSRFFKRTLALLMKSRSGTSPLEEDSKRILALAFEDLLPGLQSRLLKADSDRVAADWAREKFEKAVLPSFGLSPADSAAVSAWLGGTGNGELTAAEPRFRAEKARQIISEMLRDRNKAAKKISAILGKEVSAKPSGMDVRSYFDQAKLSADPSAAASLDMFCVAVASGSVLDVSDFKALVPALACLVPAKATGFAAAFLPAISMEDAVNVRILGEAEAKDKVRGIFLAALPDIRPDGTDSPELKAKKADVLRDFLGQGTLLRDFSLDASEYGDKVGTLVGELAVAYGKSFSDAVGSMREKRESLLGEDGGAFVGTAEDLVEALSDPSIPSHLVRVYGNPKKRVGAFEKYCLIELKKLDGTRVVARVDSAIDTAASGGFRISAMSSRDGKDVYRAPVGEDILPYDFILEAVRKKGSITVVPPDLAGKYFDEVRAGFPVSAPAGAPAEIKGEAHLSQLLDDADPDGAEHKLSVGMTFVVGEGELKDLSFRVSSIDPAAKMIAVDGEAPVTFGMFENVFRENKCGRIPEILSPESFLARMDEKFRSSNKSRAGDWGRFRFQEGVGIVTSVSALNNERFKNDGGRERYSVLEDIVGGTGNGGIRILEAGKDQVAFVRGTVKEEVTEEEKDGKKSTKTAFRVEYKDKDRFRGTYADLFAAMKSIDAFQPRVPKEEHGHQPENEKDIHLEGGAYAALKSTFRNGASINTIMGAGKLLWQTVEHSMKEFSKMGELEMSKRIAQYFPGGTGSEFYMEMEASVLGEKKKLTKALFDRIDGLPGKKKGALIKHILFSKHSQPWELDAAAQAAVSGYGRLYFDDEMRKYEGTFFWLKRLGILATEDDRKRFEKVHQKYDQANMVAPEEEILWECLKGKYSDDILNATNWVAFRNTMKEGAKKHWERGEDFTGILYDPDAVNDYCFGRLEGGEHMQTMAGIERVMKLRGTQRQVNELAFLTVFGGVAQRMPPEYRTRLENMHADSQKGYVCPPLFFIGPNDQSLFHEISIAAAERIAEREKGGAKGKNAEDFVKALTELSASVRKKSILSNGEFKKLRDYWKVYGEDMCDIMWAMKTDKHVFLKRDEEKYSKYWGRLSEKMDDEQSLRGNGSQEWFWDGRLKEWSSMVVNLELNFLRHTDSNFKKIGLKHGLWIFTRTLEGFRELRNNYEHSAKADPAKAGEIPMNDPRHLTEKGLKDIFRRMYSQLESPLAAFCSYANQHDKDSLAKMRRILAEFGYPNAAKPFDSDWFGSKGLEGFSGMADETMGNFMAHVSLPVPTGAFSAASRTRGGISNVFAEAPVLPGRQRLQPEDESTEV